MADTTASVIITKRRPETDSGFGNRLSEAGAVSGPLPTGGAITNFQEPSTSPSGTKQELTEEPGAFLDAKSRQTSFAENRRIAFEAIGIPLPAVQK